MHCYINSIFGISDIMRYILGFLSLLISVKALEAEEETFDNYSPLYIIAVVLILFTTAFANAAGIGGGPILVAIFMYTLSLGSTTSIGLCQSAILGGSLVATIMKMTYKHPHKDTHLIDYDLVGHISGPLLFGACLGSLTARITQEWMNLTALSILLWVISYITLAKGAKLYKTETKNIEIHNFLIETEVEKIPSAKVSMFTIVLSIGIYILFSFSKGDKLNSSIFGIEMCSAWYLSTFISYFAVVVITGFITGSYLLKKYKTTKRKSGEINWNLYSVIFLPFMSFFTGVLAGSLGIGGGLVLNPIFISYGLLAEVSTASCNLFVLLSSFSSFLQFFMAGLIDLRVATELFCVGMVGSFLGTFVIKKLVDKYKRSSILVFLLGSMLLVIGIIIPISLVLEVRRQVDEGSFTTQLKSVC